MVLTPISPGKKNINLPFVQGNPHNKTIGHSWGGGDTYSKVPSNAFPPSRSQKQRLVPSLEANDERQTTVGRSNSTQPQRRKKRQRCWGKRHREASKNEGNLGSLSFSLLTSLKYLECMVSCIDVLFGL